MRSNAPEATVFPWVPAVVTSSFVRIHRNDTEYQVSECQVGQVTGCGTYAIAFQINDW